MNYYAFCSYTSGPGHVPLNNWTGPIRTSQADAKKDGDAHTRQSGHAVQVLPTALPPTPPPDPNGE